MQQAGARGGHLPRERVAYPVPTACPCCGSALDKLGEDITETLKLVPRQWRVIRHVREKHLCRSCEKITATGAVAPDRTETGRPGLLAHVLFVRYGLYLPLTRQSATHAREINEAATVAAPKMRQENARSIS